jgi:hypothetical protein
MPEVRWYLQKKGSGAAPTTTAAVTVWPGGMSRSIPSDGTVTLCRVWLTLCTMRVIVPAGTLVTQVGAKKKSFASMDTAAAVAGAAPWSFTGVGKAAEGGQGAAVPDDERAVAVGAEAFVPGPPQATPARAIAPRSASARVSLLIRCAR